jgi:hypothetical protein
MLQNVAHITAWGEGFIYVFWDSDTGKILIRDEHVSRSMIHDQWCYENDGYIVDTVARFLGVQYKEELLFDQIMTFDKEQQHGKAANEQLIVNIYHLSWSDFYTWDIVIHFNVRCLYGVGPNKYRRLAEALWHYNSHPGRLPDYTEIGRIEDELRVKDAEPSPESIECSDSCHCLECPDLIQASEVRIEDPTQQRIKELEQTVRSLGEKLNDALDAEHAALRRAEGADKREQEAHKKRMDLATAYDIVKAASWDEMQKMLAAREA